MMRRLLAACFALLPLTACAARKNDAPAAQSPAGSAADGAPSTGGAAGYSPGPSQYSQPAPPPPSPSAAPPAEAPKAEPGPAQTQTTPQGRAVAINKDTNDIESAQRELDAAGSSCHNACRALGSMDRASGHLCLMTREDNTHDRCDDAKRRLYNARDKVRGSCGTCPDNQPATDRNAPVPSMR